MNRISATLVPLTALVGLYCALFLGEGSLDLSSIGLGLQLGLDATGRTFLFFSSILWLLSGIYGLGYLKGDPRGGIFNAFFFAAMLGNFGLIVALDAVTFYTCFALMSFASFGLVIHNRDAAAIRASKIYMILVVVGEVILFAGLVTLLSGSGTNLALPVGDTVAMGHFTVALLIAGFGIKAGVVGLHVWLPLAHPAAPVPASAVLSGAMIKAGLLGWIRFLPLGQDGFAAWGSALMIAGLVAAFFGVWVGLTQKNPKAILAYSSISQMGFMTLGVGAGLLKPELWPALLVAVSVYALHHGLAKGALFLSVGIAPGGMSRLAWLGVWLPGLALAGAPLTSGAAAKGALKSITHDLDGAWPGLLEVILPLAAIGTGLLIIRFLVVLHGYHPDAHGNEDRRWMLAPWAVLVIASLVLAWCWSPAAEAAVVGLKPSKLFNSAWPIAAALLVGGMIYRRPIGYLKAWVGRIPAGDLLMFAELTIGGLRRWFSRFPDLSRFFRPAIGSSLMADLASWVSRRERKMSAWQGSVVALLALALLLFLLSFAAAR